MKLRTQVSRPRTRRINGILIGAVIALSVIVYSNVDESFHAPGPENPGHEAVSCAACHRKADGSQRQQIQAKIQYWLGIREDTVVVGREPVLNEQCLDCHIRPKDRHPVYRFLEPRYSKVKNEIAPHQCITCHREHSGRRLSVDLAFCSHCHGELKLKKDPLDIAHAELVDKKRWKTCLSCHDYHGNYKFKLPDAMDKRILEKQLITYFDVGPPPYSREKLYPACEALPCDQK